MSWSADDEVIYDGCCTLITSASSTLLEAMLVDVYAGGTKVYLTTIAPSTDYNVNISKCWDNDGAVSCDVPESGLTTSYFWVYPSSDAQLKCEVFLR